MLAAAAAAYLQTAWAPALHRPRKGTSLPEDVWLYMPGYTIYLSSLCPFTPAYAHCRGASTSQAQDGSLGCASISFPCVCTTVLHLFAHRRGASASQFQDGDLTAYVEACSNSTTRNRFVIAGGAPLLPARVSIMIMVQLYLAHA